MKNCIKNQGKKLETVSWMFNRDNFDAYIDSIYRKTRKIADKYVSSREFDISDSKSEKVEREFQNYRLLPENVGKKINLGYSLRTSRRIYTQELEELLQPLSKSSQVDVFVRNLEEIKSLLLKYPELCKLAYSNGIMPYVVRLIDSDIHEEHKLGSQLLALLGKVPRLRFRGVRVLAIDGGGMRGVVSLRILQKIEELSNGKLIDMFDFVCGVSTGSLITSSVFGRQVPPEMIIKLYKQLGSEIFVRNSLIGAGKVVFSSSFYDSSIFTRILQDNFGDQNLIDFVKTTRSPKLSLLSTLVNGGEMEQFAFRNYNPPFDRFSEFRGSVNHPVWQAIRASSAIPFLLDELTVNGLTFQDGGLMHNNPTPVAISEAHSLWPSESLHCVVSIGTGRAFPSSFSMGIPPSSLGLKDKFNMILKCAADPEPMHGVLRRLLPSSVYFRLNPILSQNISFEETSEEKLDQLIHETDIYLRKNEVKLKRLIAKLSEPRTISQRLRDSVIVSKYS